MFKAEKGDRALVIDLLAAAFDHNHSVNYIIRQDRHRLERIRSLMEYSFDVCYLSGEVWLSDDKKACALVLFPHAKETSLYSIWLDVKLVFLAIGVSRLGQALKRERAIKNLQPKNDMFYLWFIGVDPVCQHLGKGTSLLREIIKKADDRRLPVYLETSALQNLPWYRKSGFEIYNQLDLGYTLFFLKHEPSNQVL